MRRHALTDEQFERIEHLLPGSKEHVGVTAKDNRAFIDGVIWIFKTGAPWRDLPERYGHWKNVHRRFSRWSSTGVFDKIFQILSKDADMEFLLMDGTIVKAHQHSSGAKKKNPLRGIATRYCKRAEYFLEAIKLASCVILMH